MKTVFKPLIILLFGVLIIDCNRDDPESYLYSVPGKSNDGWEVSFSDSLNVSSLLLSDMMNYIFDTPGHNIHSILIIKDGKLIFEEYFEGYLYSGNPPGSNGEYVTYDRETDHYLASVSKSITSVIFGIAVKEGFIDNMNNTVLDYFPEYDEVLSGAKAEITLHQLLSMSSGLDWDESSASYEQPANDVYQLFHADDPIEHILSNPLVYTPGTGFLYNSGGTNILGAIIEKSTEMDLLDFGNDYLFTPLNIEGGAWQRLPCGLMFASGGIFLRPRELAKIGYLYINDGYWEDNQIISEAWITQSVYGHIETHGRTISSSDSYGYQWWIQDFSAKGHIYDCFYAAGWGDQYMFIIPELEMIIVFNGGNYMHSGSISPFSLMEAFILNAVINL